MLRARDLERRGGVEGISRLSFDEKDKIERFVFVVATFTFFTTKWHPRWEKSTTVTEIIPKKRVWEIRKAWRIYLRKSLEN